MGYNNFELIKSRTIVGPDNVLTPDWVFENAVYKIQTNKAHELNADERESVSMIELRANDSDAEHEDELEALYRTAAEDTPNLYPNIKFICASTACVERVWSIAQRIVTKDRCSMYPKMVEALLFLKFNSELWDKYDVADAVFMVKNKKNVELNQRLTSQEIFDEWLVDFIGDINLNDDD